MVLDGNIQLHSYVTMITTYQVYMYYTYQVLPSLMANGF